MVTKDKHVKAIATALLNVQRSLDPVHKGRKGYGYTYADLAAVMDTVLEGLNKEGVVVVQSPTVTEKQAAAIVTRLIHAATGEEITSTIEVPWSVGGTKMSDAQAYGAAITYGRRYALVSMVCVATEDTDAAGLGNAPQRPVRAPEPAKPSLSAKDRELVAGWLSDAENEPMMRAAWQDVVTAGMDCPEVRSMFADRKKALGL